MFSFFNYSIAVKNNVTIFFLKKTHSFWNKVSFLKVTFFSLSYSHLARDLTIILSNSVCLSSNSYASLFFFFFLVPKHAHYLTSDSSLTLWCQTTFPFLIWNCPVFINKTRKKYIYLTFLKVTYKKNWSLIVKTKWSSTFRRIFSLSCTGSANRFFTSRITCFTRLPKTLPWRRGVLNFQKGRVLKSDTLWTDPGLQSGIRVRVLRLKKSNNNNNNKNAGWEWTVEHSPQILGGKKPPSHTSECSEQYPDLISAAAISRPNCLDARNKTNLLLCVSLKLLQLFFSTVWMQGSVSMNKDITVRAAWNFLPASRLIYFTWLTAINLSGSKQHPSLHQWLSVHYPLQQPLY